MSSSQVDHGAAPVVSLESLRQAGREPSLPFALTLPEGGRLEFTRLLRLLPGKRLAGLALWNGQPAFAKLFVGADARRYGERERAGLAALATANLPTPDLRFAGPIGECGYLVLTAFLDGAATLKEQQSTPREPQPVLSAMHLLGRLHGAGLVQQDPHFGNFLLYRGQLLLIDGDGVRADASASGQLANLARLLAEMEPAWDGLRQELLQGWGRQVDANALESAVAAARQRRLRRFLTKTVRDCSRFVVHKEFRRFTAVLREQWPALQSLLSAPDAAMASGECLKDGGTCTVAAIEAGGQRLVVKRYNLKHWRHALSRAWRPSRAWHSWQAAYRLHFYGIATPRALALIEERRGALRGRAFFIAEHCPGISLRDLLDSAQEPEPAIQQALHELFQLLHRLHITHGDLKASNLLWHDGRIVLIDLDALTEHRSQSSFVHAWRRDRTRLLRNWPTDSTLAQWLERVLPG
ncbi:MAG: hypothetical protein LBE81_05055 [Azonexus sp.]|jgi:tRNA A-37 threonylcarbamoyl transferase component Bud32|uniref:lipopolysaccharide kinase InaA family protein n=1 Tax=Azonexus sp. TaxID=1872668 RepID=UPI00281A684B|nr:lipopolysaccharide kinase InaA family protein [Azonexus sp.]MDR0775988.1 hypothetical protein [Azonexus sp.]